MNGVAKKFLWMAEDEIECGHFRADAAEVEKQTILFRDAIEAPREVRRVAVEAANIAHPLATPRSGIKEWHDAEGARHSVTQRSAKKISGDQSGIGRIGCIEQIVEAIEILTLDTIGNTPIQKIRTLVFRRGGGLMVLRSKIADLARTLALLNLPARKVGVNQDLWLGQKQGGAGADYDDRRGSLLLNFSAAVGEQTGICEILNRE